MGRYGKQLQDEAESLRLSLLESSDLSQDDKDMVSSETNLYMDPFVRALVQGGLHEEDLQASVGEMESRCFLENRSADFEYKDFRAICLENKWATGGITNTFMFLIMYRSQMQTQLYHVLQKCPAYKAQFPNFEKPQRVVVCPSDSFHSVDSSDCYLNCLIERVICFLPRQTDHAGMPFDKFMGIVNVNKSHWILAGVDLKHRAVFVMDPMNQKYTVVGTNLLRAFGYIGSIPGFKYLDQSRNKWGVFYPKVHRDMQQKDGNSCGFLSYMQANVLSFYDGFDIFENTPFYDSVKFLPHVKHGFYALLAGMKEIHIPVPFASLTGKEIEDYLKALAKQNPGKYPWKQPEESFGESIG